MHELKHLSCPFTWDMSSVTSYSGRILNRENERLSYWMDEDNNDFKNISIMKLMFSLMTSYEYTEDDKLEEAIKQIEISEQIFIELVSAPNNISIKAVDHILKGTKCFILERMNKSSEITSIFKTFHLCHQDTVELGTLYGCRAIAWSFYFDAGVVETIRNSEKAIKLDSNNGLWHFILGKGLRTKRKCSGSYSNPSGREQMAFHSAFMLLCNAYIGTYHAHTQYESKNLVEAKNIYTMILSMKPSEYDIYLKLALGFIRLRESDKADVCLKHLEEKVPSNPKYLHYKGLYLEKCKKDSEHFQDFMYNPKTNIYHVLKMDIIPKLKSIQDLNESTFEMIKQAEEAYKAYQTHITEDANGKMTDN
ncbi:uncharacterized protein LOC107266176 [Cephus cinctus]|uniref:Uncharacterized protein LOC107266176 n=1 Tax=Cephus cinctus TaxID=211228 RepID=A0AAJ7REX0_CEPCN|nr:uncharacterized protein LOC107266176 [Cephus cinctus]